MTQIANIFQKVYNSTIYNHPNKARHQLLNFVIKIVKNLLRKNKGKLTIFIVGMMLWIKREQDRKIRIISKQTDVNKEILRILDPHIKSYNPTFWIPSSFAKMLMVPRQPLDHYEFYRRWKLPLPDGEEIAIDILPTNHTKLHPETPTIILLPGIYSDSNKGDSFKFCETAKKMLNWRICVINRRGYGDMPYLKDKLSNFILYEDLHFAINSTSKRFPNSRIYLVGISMGAMNIQRYLAEYGKCTKVQAAVTISSPWNSYNSVKKIESNIIIRNFIRDSFLKRIKKHFHDENFINVCEKKGIDLCKLNLLI